MKRWPLWLLPTMGFLMLGVTLGFSLNALVDYIEIDVLTTVLGTPKPQPIGLECAAIAVLIVALVLWGLLLNRALGAKR